MSTLSLSPAAPGHSVPAKGQQETPRSETEYPKEIDTVIRGTTPFRNILRGLISPLVASLLVLGFAGFVLMNWDRWIGLAATQTTDDAQIRAQTSRLSSRISGTVRAVAVQDFQQVREGDLLVELDPVDYKIAVDQAQAGVEAAEAVLANLDNQIALQKTTIEQAKAERESAAAKELQARQEYERQKNLLRTGNSPQQRAEQAIAAHVTANSNLRVADVAIEAQSLQLAVLRGNKKQRTAELAAARSGLKAAQLHLSYARITAPFDGIVGELQVQTGSYVGIGTSLVSLVPLREVHIIANYKETQLARIAPGQPVDILVDAAPDVTFKGYVERISPGSGSQFALLPPDNASGNFTKVVQRIPVRISFIQFQPQLERLRAGMSVTTRIQTSENGNRR